MKTFSHSTAAVICITFFLMQLISCSRDKCYDNWPYDIKFSSVDLVVKNNAGTFLYNETNPIYNKDSLKVFDESGNQLEILYELRQALPNYWEFSARSIYNPQTDANAFNSELCKKLIIKYTYTEADTITTCFRAEKLDCGSELNYLKIFQNGLLIGQATNNLRATATVIKD